MERERGSKVIAIVALCVGVIGLSLGFAAFSSQLAIKSSATVTPDASTFGVEFTAVSVDTDESTTGVAGSPSVGSEQRTDSEGESYTVSTIGDLSAAFTAPGQKVVYNATITNVGEYAAFLKSVSATSKTCTAREGTNQGYVDDACEGISLTVTIDGTDYSAGNDAISGKSIAIGGEHNVVVTIEYAAGSAKADGAFDVEFTDIDILYESV